jgi:hypothetical protein
VSAWSCVKDRSHVTVRKLTGCCTDTYANVSSFKIFLYMGGELRHSNKSHIRARLVSEFFDRLVFRTELDVSEIG